jgi:hypothetical protein
VRVDRTWLITGSSGGALADSAAVAVEPPTITDRRAWSTSANGVLPAQLAEACEVGDRKAQIRGRQREANRLHKVMQDTGMGWMPPYSPISNVRSEDGADYTVIARLG